MAKKFQSYIKLQIPAGKANPSPPIGPALGQRGVNIMEFCKEFNKITSKIENSTPIPVVITVYTDKSFSFIIKSPPVSYLLKKAAGVEKGSSSTSSSTYIGKVTIKQIEEIANTKIADSNTIKIQSMIKMIKGSAKAMGIEVVK